MSDTVDVIYPVAGDCVHVGYGYPLFAALCGLWPFKGCGATYIGPIEHVRPLPGSALLGITSETQIRIRATPDALGFVRALSGQRLRVGGHCIDLGKPAVRLVRPAATLHAELVTFSWCRTENGRRGYDPIRYVQVVRDALPHLRADQIVIGRKRRLTVRSRGHYHGHAIELRHLHTPDSLHVQAYGLGSKRHMGCALFVPGPLPVSLHAHPGGRLDGGTRRRVYVPAAEPA